MIADNSLNSEGRKKEYIQKNINKSLKGKEKDYEQTAEFLCLWADRKIIADILHKHFGEMIEVPSHKDSLELFEDTVDKRFYLLTDLDSKEHITYREHTYYDQREALCIRWI